jgi:hypothetical protein
VRGSCTLCGVYGVYDCAAVRWGVVDCSLGCPSFVSHPPLGSCHHAAPQGLVDADCAFELDGLKLYTSDLGLSFTI